MGLLDRGLKLAEEAAKAAEEAAKAEQVAAAAKAAEKAKKIEEGKALAGTKTLEGGAPRLGIRQRELDALKADVIGRTGEKGWQNLTSDFRARLEQGGEFPLRFSRSGPQRRVGTLGTDITGRPITLARRIPEQVERSVERMTGKKIEAGAPTKAELRETAASIDRRASREEQRVRESISGFSPAQEGRTAASAGQEFASLGAPGGVRSISQGVANYPGSTYDRLQRGIQSGAVRGVVGGTIGAEIVNEIKNTYSGPDNSHRNPQVQWGRNRQ